jgi:hypothetical protein
MDEKDQCHNQTLNFKIGKKVWEEKAKFSNSKKQKKNK